MSIQHTRARIGELQEQASWLKAQRAAALADHARGMGGASDRVAAHGNALTALQAELDLEHEVLEHMGENACRDSEVTRRAAARQAAADAVAALKENERLAAMVDAAVDALVAAMQAHTGKATEASDLAKRAVKLAIPNLASRSVIAMGSPTAGSFTVSAASALRQIFQGVDNPHHIFEFAPGMTLPVGERLPFLDSAKWASRMLQSVESTVESACKVEEALVADLKSRESLA